MIIRAIIYDSTTGEILSEYKGSDSELSANTPSGCSSLITEGSILDKKVVNGALVSLTSAEIATRDLTKNWNNLRKERQALLADSDWRLLEDSGVTNKEEWKTYRQALRDLPANTTDPTNVTWPTKPS